MKCNATGLYCWFKWGTLKGVPSSQSDPPCPILTVPETTAMSDKDLRQRLERAVGALEASIQHVSEVNHRRLSKLEADVAADQADLRSRFVEAEDGIVRHRDALMREFNELASDVRVLNGRMDRLEGTPRAERILDSNYVVVPVDLFEDLKVALDYHHEPHLLARLKARGL